MTYPEVIEVIPVSGGKKAMEIDKGAKTISLKFDKSLARYYGTILMSVEADGKSYSTTFNLPFVKPSCSIPLPRLFRKFCDQSHLELWSKETFRGNWHADFELPGPDCDRREVTFTLELRPRFTGTRRESYWSGQESETVTFRLRE
jgi:hypothetical protein